MRDASRETRLYLCPRHGEVEVSIEGFWPRACRCPASECGRPMLYQGSRAFRDAPSGERIVPLYCEEAKERFGLQLWECCESCHEDSDNGYADLLESEVDRVPILSCCRVHEALKEVQRRLLESREGAAGSV